MLRVVVAVALAAALLGASMPAIETVRVDHADARIAAEVDGLLATAERLAERNDPAPPGTPGARRTYVLHAPGPSWGVAALDRLTVPAASEGNGSTISWRVQGGRETQRRVSVPLVGPNDGLLLRGGGSRTLVLELTRREGQVVVAVSRVEFKSDAAASPAHDAVADRTSRRVFD